MFDCRLSKELYNTLFFVFLGCVDKFISEMEGFMNDKRLNRAKDFGLGFIHDDSFSGRKFFCAQFNKLEAMGGMANK